MKVVQDFDRPRAHNYYAVAGRLLFIESCDPRLGKLVRELFAGWLLTPVCFPNQTPDVNIRFLCNETLPEIPEGLDEFEIAEGGRCYTNGDSYYLDLDNSLMLIRQAVAVNISLWIKDLRDAPYAALARATSFAVCAGLRRCGLFELHSAGVIDPAKGTGVLLIGRSGSGKSTLTLQLAMSGWRYLSDDELFLSWVNGEVDARGFRSFFAISKTVAVETGISSLRNSVIKEARSAGKICFEPVDVFPSAHAQQMVPTLLLFTSISGQDETRMSKLTQAETMARLIRACPWATYDKAIAPANLALLSRLARQTKAFDFMAGRDLLNPGCASALLTTYTRLN